MAYKFQLGQAKLSGSIVQTDGTLDVNASTVDSLDVSSGGITNAGAIAGATTISGSGTISGGGLVVAGTTATSAGLAVLGGADAGAQRTSLGLAIGSDVQAYDAGLADIAGLAVTDGNIIVGDGSNWVAESGATARTSLGLGTSNNVQFAQITGSAIALANASGIAGEGLDDNSGFLDVSVDGSSIEISANSLQVKAGGITNAMLSGSIENAKLTNSDVTIGSTAVSLGATQTSFSGLTGLDFTAANASIAASIGANTLTLGGATSTIRVAGDLDVVGTLNRVTETELLIEDKVVIVASGSASGSAAAGAGLKVDIATGDVTWLYQVNGENVGGVDASASGDIFVASGSAGLIDIQAAAFYGNGANLTGVSATNSRVSVNAIADSATDDIDAAGFWLAVAQSQETTVTLNHASSWTDGDVVYIKSMNAGTNNVIIAPASGEDMEGVTNGTLLLESDGAAVTLIRAGGNAWYIV